VLQLLPPPAGQAELGLDTHPVSTNPTTSRNKNSSFFIFPSTSNGHFRNRLNHLIYVIPYGTTAKIKAVLLSSPFS
jgi:hypothetical protein